MAEEKLSPIVAQLKDSYRAGYDNYRKLYRDKYHGPQTSSFFKRGSDAEAQAESEQMAKDLLKLQKLDEEAKPPFTARCRKSWNEHVSSSTLWSFEQMQKDFNLWHGTEKAHQENIDAISGKLNPADEEAIYSREEIEGAVNAIRQAREDSHRSSGWLPGLGYPGFVVGLVFALGAVVLEHPHLEITLGVGLPLAILGICAVLYYRSATSPITADDVAGYFTNQQGAGYKNLPDIRGVDS